MSRLFAWSDLHVDYPENFRLIAELSDSDYSEDTILIAGDLSSDPEKLIACLTHLKRKFREVAFVPGNHDLWVSSRDGSNSLEKLFKLYAACRAIDVQVEPFETILNNHPVCVVPLLTWYLKPEEDEGSLFIEKPGEDPTLRIWADNYRIKWPVSELKEPAAHPILALNKKSEIHDPSIPVVSFSHFLPRVELVFSDCEQFLAGGLVKGNDANPEFNFTRVAGCKQIDTLLRNHGSIVHVYGHQHRNRDRAIEGVRYISHCLGYPKEWSDLKTEPPRHLPLEVSLPDE